jgi:hypothetical protein
MTVSSLSGDRGTVERREKRNSEEDDMPDGFGRLHYLGRGSASVSLDLYEEEAQIIGRGFYLGSEEDLSILHEVELAIDRGSFDAVESETGLADLSYPIADYALEYPDSPPLNISVYRPDPSRKLIVGRIGVLDDDVIFRGEEYGSPEIIVIVVVCVWALICGGSALRDLVRTCEERAIEVCGRGGVKAVKSKRSWGKFKCGATCEIECLDGQTTRTDLRGTLNPAASPG